METDSPFRSGDSPKAPRTERGRRTLRKLLDAAAIEFGEKGFYEASISGITTRAETALGTFYTYFDSKDEIFRALVHDMSDRVRRVAGEAVLQADDGWEAERAALSAFLKFAREHREIYRIIDEAEFVDPQAYREHYQVTANRILARLCEGSASGHLRDDLNEIHAWAIMGMNVFLGIRYCIWSNEPSINEIVDTANSILRHGICAPEE